MFATLGDEASSLPTVQKWDVWFRKGSLKDDPISDSQRKNCWHGLKNQLRIVQTQKNKTSGTESILKFVEFKVNWIFSFNNLHIFLSLDELRNIRQISNTIIIILVFFQGPQMHEENIDFWKYLKSSEDVSLWKI